MESEMLEWKIRKSLLGERNLDSVSRKLVLNRSANLIQDNAASYSKYRKESKTIKVQWNTKM